MLSSPHTSLYHLLFQMMAARSHIGFEEYIYIFLIYFLFFIICLTYENRVRVSNLHTFYDTIYLPIKWNKGLFECDTPENIDEHGLHILV